MGSVGFRRQGVLGNALLGGLASAPAIVGSEKFKEIIKKCKAQPKVLVDQRFNVKDLGWRLKLH